MPTKLSPNFTLEELTRTDHREFDNTPNPDQINNLTRVAQLLEEVKKCVGNKPVMVNSGFRSLQVNNAVGSKPTSQHCLGCAADIRIPGMTPDEVVQAIRASNIQYDQLIREFDSWTHISVPNEARMTPRGQTLIIDKQGTRSYATS
jgi:Iap family predicted aminopeptidase